jgi:ribose transport system permease protein
MALMFSSRINAVSSSNFGVGLELDAIAAVVIGGTSMKGGRGWIWGTVIGVIILGVVSSMLNWLNVSAYLQGAVKGLVIIAAVLVQRGRGETK